jgi:anti-sigma-K factor RskA
VTEKNKPPEQVKESLLSKVTNFFSDSVRSIPFLSTPMYRLTTALSVVVMVLATLVVNPVFNSSDQLSYVAVLTNEEGSAHIVASTYGESQKLVVNVVNTPAIEKDQALELWVVSKTDAQARSLGVIPQGETLIEQQLTQAQWRLIKDSDSLIVTIEDAGGSPIGEPSEYIVSKGLCVRLQEWNTNV